MADVRVTQTATEVAALHPIAEGVRVTQTAIEVASVQVSPELRQTQGLIEIASPHQTDLAWFGRGVVVGVAGAGVGKDGFWV